MHIIWRCLFCQCKCCTNSTADWALNIRWMNTINFITSQHWIESKMMCFPFLYCHTNEKKKCVFAVDKCILDECGVASSSLLTFTWDMSFWQCRHMNVHMHIVGMKGQKPRCRTKIREQRLSQVCLCVLLLVLTMIPVMMTSKW